jgi:hypothetical protein
MTLRNANTEPPGKGGSVLAKIPNTGFPELRVSAKLPLGHPVTAHAASLA